MSAFFAADPPASTPSLPGHSPTCPIDFTEDDDSDDDKALAARRRAEQQQLLAGEDSKIGSLSKIFAAVQKQPTLQQRQQHKLVLSAATGMASPTAALATLQAAQLPQQLTPRQLQQLASITQVTPRTSVPVRPPSVQALQQSIQQQQMRSALSAVRAVSPSVAAQAGAKLLGNALQHVNTNGAQRSSQFSFLDLVKALSPKSRANATPGNVHLPTQVASDLKLIPGAGSKPSFTASAVESVSSSSAEPAAMELDGGVHNTSSPSTLATSFMRHDSDCKTPSATLPEPSSKRADSLSSQTTTELKTANLKPAELLAISSKDSIRLNTNETSDDKATSKDVSPSNDMSSSTDVDAASSPVVSDEASSPQSSKMAPRATVAESSQFVTTDAAAEDSKPPISSAVAETSPTPTAAESSTVAKCETESVTTTLPAAAEPSTTSAPLPTALAAPSIDTSVPKSVNEGTQTSLQNSPISRHPPVVVKEEAVQVEVPLLQSTTSSLTSTAVSMSASSTQAQRSRSTKPVAPPRQPELNEHMPVHHSFLTDWGSGIPEKVPEGNDTKQFPKTGYVPIRENICVSDSIDFRTRWKPSKCGCGKSSRKSKKRRTPAVRTDAMEIVKPGKREVEEDEDGDDDIPVVGAFCTTNECPNRYVVCWYKVLYFGLICTVLLSRERRIFGIFFL